MAYSSPDEGTSVPSSLMPNPNNLNADVGLTYTEGMHDQQIAQVLLTYARGGDCEALGVPHHTDLTLPMPMAGHVYLQTSSQWDGKVFRSEQKRPRVPDGMRCVPHRVAIPLAHAQLAFHRGCLPLSATVGINGTVRANWSTFQGTQTAGNSTWSTSACETARAT